MGAGQGRARRAQAARRRPSRPAPAPGERRPVLLSLQPRWSREILEGRKTIELRRNRSGCEAGTPIVIYTSYPVRRVEGRCEVASVISGTPDELWPLVKEQCGDTREEYDEYFQGAEKAYAIQLSKVERLDPSPIPFNGPQSYRYLFDDEPEQRGILGAAGLLEA